MVFAEAGFVHAVELFVRAEVELADFGGFGVLAADVAEFSHHIERVVLAPE